MAFPFFAPTLAIMGSGLWKAGAIALVAAGLWMHGCSVGKKGEHEKLVVLDTAYKVAAAQSEARAKERLKAQTNVVSEAGKRYEKIVYVDKARAVSERVRLRDSAARGAGLPATTTPSGCPAPVVEATGTELVGFAEGLIGLVEQANRDHAALAACLEAWPR